MIASPGSSGGAPGVHPQIPDGDQCVAGEYQDNASVATAAPATGRGAARSACSLMSRVSVSRRRRAIRSIGQRTGQDAAAMRNPRSTSQAWPQIDCRAALHGPRQRFLQPRRICRGEKQSLAIDSAARAEAPQTMPACDPPAHRDSAAGPLQTRGGRCFPQALRAATSERHSCAAMATGCATGRQSLAIANQCARSAAAPASSSDCASAM